MSRARQFQGCSIHIWPTLEWTLLSVDCELETGVCYYIMVLARFRRTAAKFLVNLLHAFNHSPTTMISENILRLIQAKDTVSSLVAQNPSETPSDGELLGKNT